MKKRTKKGGRAWFKAQGESDCAKGMMPATQTTHLTWPEWAVDAYREGWQEVVRANIMHGGEKFARAVLRGKYPEKKVRAAA